MRWIGGVESALAYDETGVTGRDREADESMSFGKARRHRYRLSMMWRSNDPKKLRVGSGPTARTDQKNPRRGSTERDGRPWWLGRKFDESPTVEDCLRSYFREAPLGSTFQCESCKSRGVVVGRPYLASLPTVLAVMLKRFEFVFSTRGGGDMVKKSTPVLFDAGGGKPLSARENRRLDAQTDAPTNDGTPPDLVPAAIVSAESAGADLALHMTSFVHPDFSRALHPGRPVISSEESTPSHLVPNSSAVPRLRRPSFTGSVAGEARSDSSLDHHVGASASNPRDHCAGRGGGTVVGRASAQPSTLAA